MVKTGDFVIVIKGLWLLETKFKVYEVTICDNDINHSIALLGHKYWIKKEDVVKIA